LFISISRHYITFEINYFWYILYRVNHQVCSLLFFPLIMNLLNFLFLKWNFDIIYSDNYLKFLNFFLYNSKSVLWQYKVLFLSNERGSPFYCNLFRWFFRKFWCTSFKIQMNSFLDITIFVLKILSLVVSRILRILKLGIYYLYI